MLTCEAGPRAHRQYQARLFRTKKLVPAMGRGMHRRCASFFVKTRHRHFLAELLPTQNAASGSPSSLAELVARLIDSGRNHYQRTLLMTLYSTGMSRAELCSFKVSDIDSQRMFKNEGHCP
jgi:hypothetical protein